MQLHNLGANKTELRLDDGLVVFFSYNTPVAAVLAGGGGFVQTEKKWSVTTSKHTTMWLDGVNARKVPQETLDSLIS